jgi:hypothetical protein
MKGNYHSIINSFYFNALISDRPINLDRGLLFAVDWLNPFLQMKPFHAWYFFTIKQTISSKPRQLFQQLSQNQRQSNQDLLSVSSRPQSSGLGSILLHKIVALQLVTLLVFLSHVLFKTKWGAIFFESRPFLRLLK